MTKPTKVGVFSLGLVDVAVYLSRDTDARFDFTPTDGSPTITVGSIGGWRSAHARLHHEAYEMAYVLGNLRFVPSFDCARDNGAYLFSMTHTQFSEANAQAAGFLLHAVPALKKAINRLAKR
jgi:hypothetical protein